MDPGGESIRQAVSPRDIDLVRELFREYADWLEVDQCFEGFERELAMLPGNYAPPDGRVLLAFDRRRAVGCVALRRSDSTTGEIKRLYVRPEARGLRTGRRLVERVILAARQIGYRRLVLETLPQMPEARALYGRFGFREIPGRDASPSSAVVNLALELAPTA